MKLPRQGAGQYDNTLERVTLSHAERDWREARRAQRLGYATYWEARGAKKSYLKARQHMQELLDANRAA